MIIILRNILFSILGFTSFLISMQAYGQCTEVPVKEAVKNGDFEKGYVNGAGTAYLSGGAIDFTHAFQWPYAYSGNNTQCIWGAANQAGIARNQRHKCGFGPYIGFKYYGNAKFKDHTPGKNGNGFALILDMVGKQTKTAWKQNTTVYANQKYYFSAWFAKYTGGNWVGNLRFYVTGNKTKKRVLVSSAKMNAGLLQWRQFNGTWNSDNNTAVTLEIVFVGSGITNADDFVIDDISFINGCQKIKTFVSYEAEFAKEEVSLCYNNGSYKAQVKKDDGTNLGSTGKAITWYKGGGASQTEVTEFANQDAPNITSPGTYRACIVDVANGGCTVNASMKITEDLSVSLPATATLCDPAQITIDTKRTEAGLTHSWTVPAGATKSTNNKQVVNVGGDYVANVSLPSNPNCKASATTKVTSNLPSVPTNLKYCEGGGEKTALKHQNKYWKWCKDKDCKNGIGKGTSVDYTLPAGTSGDQTVYMQSAVTSNAGTVGPNAVSKYPTGGGMSTVFNAYQAIQLASVQVQSLGWGGVCKGGGKKPNVTFTVTGPNGFKVTKVVRITCGATTTAKLGIDIPKGNGYRLTVSGGKVFNFNTVSRRTINGVILLGTGNTVFKNWVIRKSEACAPVAVTLKPEQCCLTPKSVSVTATQEDLCVNKNDKSNLSVDVQYESGTTASDFISFWVKDGTADPLNATKITKITNLTSANAGDYTHVVVDKAKPNNIGCAKTSTVTLTALPAPTVANAGKDVTDLCTEEYDLQGNTLATGETGKWTVKSGSGNFVDDTNPTTKVTGVGFGDNVFVWTITNSCGKTDDEVKITRLEPISGGSLAAVAPTKVDICANTTDHAFEVTGITGTNPVYNWTMPTGVTQNGSGASIKVNVGSVTAGTNDKLKVAVTGDCPGKVDLDITLNWNAIPDVSSASIGTINPICVSNTGQQKLEVTGVTGTVDNYEWSAVDQVSLTEVTQITDTKSSVDAQLTEKVTFGVTEENKTIKIEVKAQNVCGTSAVVEGSARIDNLPTESKIAFTDAKLCIKDPIFLSGNTPVIGTGKWVTAGSTTGGTVKDENDGGSELTNLQGGQKYEGKWVISNGVCPASEENVSVEGEGIVDAEISFNVQGKVCEGEEVIIEAFGKNGGDTPIYKFLDESGSELIGGTLSASGTDYTFIPSVGDTKVQVEFTSNSSCVQTTDPIKADFQTITVEAAPKGLSITKPIPTPGDVFETCETTVSLEATATVGTVSWNTTPISGTGTITDNGSGKAEITGIPEGTTIEVQAVSSSGTTCAAITETVKVEVKGKITPAKLEDDYTICISDAGTVNILNQSGTLKTGELGTWGVGVGDNHLTVTSSGSVSGLKVGANTITYSIDNGLCPISTDEIIITVEEAPTGLSIIKPIPSLGDVFETCETTVTLEATATIGTVSWNTTPISGTGTITDNGSGKAEITGIPEGTTVEIQAVSSNGTTCTAITETVKIEVKGKITPAKLEDDYTICISDAGTVNILNQSGSLKTGELGTWGVGAGDNHLTVTNGSVSGLKVGANTITYSIDNGLCPISTDEIIITVEDAPTGLSITKPVPSSGDVFETCETTVTLEATATIGTVSWNTTPISGTGTITDNGSGKAEIIEIPEGTIVEVQAISSNGTTCTAITETVKIEVKGKITPAKLEDDYAICISDAGTVNIVNQSGTLKSGEIGTWGVGAGDNHLTVTNGSVSGLKVGTNKITYSIDNGLCEDSTDEIIITVDELPQEPTLTDVVTCDSKIGLNGVNPNTSLEGQNPGSAGVWLWEVVTPNGGTITDSTDPLSEITSLATNGNNKTDITVKATITNGECSASDDMVISQLGTIPNISFNYQGTDYTNGKIENGSPQTIGQLCVGTTMSVDVVGADADHVGTWTGETDGITATSSTNSVDLTFSKVGTYTLEYTLAKKSDAACNAKASLTLVSLDKPDAPTKSGTDPAPVCEGSDITFTANAVVGAESYQWENDFGLGNNGTSNNEDYTFPSEANGTVTVFAKNICGNSTGSVSYNVEVVSPAAITINSVISELCAEGNKAPQNLETLSSFSGKVSSGVSNNYTNTYTWYDDATDAVINPKSYPVTGAATIRVEGTNEVCTTPVKETTSFKTINPTIILEDEYQLTRTDGDRKLICLSSKATTPFLKDVGAGTGTYEWEVYGVPQPPTTNQLFLEGALIDGLFEEQPITVTKTVPGCSQPFGPVTVNVYSIPEANPKLEFVSERKYICADDESAGNKVSLQVVDLGISTSGHYITSYSWNTGQTGKIENLNKGGDYYVDVNHTPSASFGFNATDVDKVSKCNARTTTFSVPSYDVSVAIEEIEPIDAQNGDESTDVNVISLGSTNASPTYIWTIDSYTGLQVAFGTNADITVENMPSTDTIYLTSKYEECTATAKAPILVYEEVTPPNVFSPNGDGQHDTWEVPGLETYPEASVTIYNRWGNVVYQNTGGYTGDREWDGKNQNTGGDVTVGAFYYVIELNKEGRKPITGHINVIR